MDPERLILCGPTTTAEISSCNTIGEKDQPVEEVTCLLFKGTYHFPPSRGTLRRKTQRAQPKKEKEDLEGKLSPQDPLTMDDTSVGWEEVGADIGACTYYE